MKRREFVNWVGLGLLASSLPVAIAACQSSEQSADTSASEPLNKIDTTPREDGFSAIGTVAQLDEQGFLSDKAFFAGSVVIVRDPTESSKVLAVNSLCTHQGCQVAWKQDSGQFVCPCHQSTYQPDGSKVSGPATKDLATFEAKIDGDLVLIKA